MTLSEIISRLVTGNSLLYRNGSRWTIEGIDGDDIYQEKVRQPTIKTLKRLRLLSYTGLDVYSGHCYTYKGRRS